jgi:hypothetical protein
MNSSNFSDPVSGELHLTISIRLNSESKLFDPPFTDKLTLDSAIRPFFLDITDSGRHFLHKKNPERIVDPISLNISGEKINIVVPSVLSWSTEGDSIKAEFSNNNTLPAILRRFWYRHIDGMFTLNLSMYLKYNHCAKDYYSIAALQKAIFPSQENMESINEVDGLYINSHGNSIWNFIGDIFQEECSGAFGSKSLNGHKSWKEYLGLTNIGITQENCLVKSVFVFKDDFFL